MKRVVIYNWLMERFGVRNVNKERFDGRRSV